MKILSILSILIITSSVIAEEVITANQDIKGTNSNSVAKIGASGKQTGKTYFEQCENEQDTIECVQRKNREGRPDPSNKNSVPAAPVSAPMYNSKIFKYR